MERLRPRVYRDALRAFGVRAHGGSLRSPARRVAGLSQFARNQVGGELLSGPYLSRRSINLGCFGKKRLLQARVDYPLVLEVIEVEHRKGRHRERRCAHQRDAHQQHCPRVVARWSRQPDFQRHRHSIHPGNHESQTINSSASSSTRFFTCSNTSFKATSTLLAVARVTTSTCPAAAFLPTLIR